MEAQVVTVKKTEDVASRLIRKIRRDVDRAGRLVIEMQQVLKRKKAHR